MLQELSQVFEDAAWHKYLQPCPNQLEYNIVNMKETNS